MMEEHRIKQNDTSPPLVGTPVDEDGVAIPLTAAVSATFKMKKPDGTIKVNDAAAVIDTGAGTLTYEWLPADTNEDGLFDGEFTVTWSDGTVTTFPNHRYIRIKILEELA